jgi:hypothetical protein
MVGAAAGAPMSETIKHNVALASDADNQLVPRTFFPPTLEIEGLRLGNYLARLAAEATTIINVTEYAKTVRDL